MAELLPYAEVLQRIIEWILLRVEWQEETLGRFQLPEILLRLGCCGFLLLNEWLDFRYLVFFIIVIFFVVTLQNLAIQCSFKGILLRLLLLLLFFGLSQGMRRLD